MKNISQMLSCFALLLPWSFFAQQPNPTFSGLTEVRSLDPEYNQMNLALDFEACRLDEDAEIKLLHVYAVDDLGNKLESTGKTPEFESPGHFYAQLELPPREAAQLQKVHMTYRIFSPSEANKSRLHIAGFAGKPYQNLLAGHYEGINLMLVDSLDFRMRWSDLITEDIPLATLQDGKSMEPLAPSRRAYFLYEDPNGRVADIRILDSEGNPIKAGRNWFDSSKASVRCWNLSAENEIQMDWILEVIIRNEADMTDYELELSDIPLH